MCEVDMAKTSLVSIVGGPARSPAIQPSIVAFSRSSGSKQTVLVLSPLGTGMEGVRDVMEAAQGGHGRGWSSLPVHRAAASPSPAAAPDFPALFSQCKSLAAEGSADLGG